MDDFTEEDFIKEVKNEELSCEKCSIIFNTNAHLRKHIESNQSLGPKFTYHSSLIDALSYKNCKEEPEECGLV